MIGALPPTLPQVASAAVEPAQAAAAPRPADDPRAGTAVELGQAARPIPGDGGQRGIEGAIAATQNQIFMTEAAADRDRARLERYPAEIQGLQAQISEASSEADRATLGERLSGLQNSMGAAQQRLAEYDANWPEQRAQLESQISSYKSQLAGLAYSQL